MKLRCPRCHQKLSLPDKYAGRAIRCPACNRAFAAPKPKTALAGPGTEAGLDLEGLAEIETHSAQITPEEIARAQASEEAKQAEAPDPVDENTRTCPNCHKQVRVEDPYAEILCSHCWNPIPARIKGSHVEAAARRAAKAAKGPGPGDFYAGLAMALTYPIQALASLITAACIGIGAILIPVAVMTAASNLMEQGAVGTEEGVQAADLTGVRITLIVIFAAEVFFFSAVALHAFLDVVRTTLTGSDRAPNLTWSPGQWGKSLAAYLVLALYLGVMSYCVAALALSGSVNAFLLQGDFSGLIKAGGTGFLAGMVIIALVIPMNLIGLSLGSILNAIHPVKVARSIARTHAHYVFLLMLLCVFAICFAGAFVTLLEWFIPQVRLMAAGSIEGHLVQVLLGLLAWGLVMGFFFYATYILARLHGLFARTFHKSLAFETS